MATCASPISATAKNTPRPGLEALPQAFKPCFRANRRRRFLDAVAIAALTVRRHATGVEILLVELREKLLGFSPPSA